MSDDEVYQMARHYYLEDIDPKELQIIYQPNQVVSNTHIELSEEEKAQAKERALKEYKDKCIKAEEERARKEEEKAQKKAEQLPKRKKSKKPRGKLKKQILIILKVDCLIFCRRTNAWVKKATVNYEGLSSKKYEEVYLDYSKSKPPLTSKQKKSYFRLGRKRKKLFR